MTDQRDTTDSSKHRGPGSLFEASRRLLLAAIGSAVYAQDEVEDFISRMVDRGEIAEKDGRALIKEMIEKRKERRDRVEMEVNDRFRDTLKRLNIPTRSDIEELSSKIAELTRKIEELKSKE